MNLKSMRKIALIGCGRIAKRHADLLTEDESLGGELVAVCDVNEVRAREFGAKYGVPWYQDMHQLAREEQVEVFTVLTPSGLHAEHVVALAPYGKHLIVEKPMALRLEDADRMIEVCKQQGVKLFVIKQNRFNVPVRKLREAVESARFGKLVMGTVRVRWSRTQAYYDQDAWRGTWAYDGGVLANQASHHVDMLEWMMGEVESVVAYGRTALVDIEAEDTVVAIMQFKSGALGIIEATTAVRPTDLEGSISVLGEKGTVEVGGFAMNRMKVWQFSDSQEGDEDVLENYSENPPDVYGFGHRSYYRDVLRCIEDNGVGLVGGSEGRRSLELITAIYESIESGKKVFLPVHPEYCKLGRR